MHQIVSLFSSFVINFHCINLPLHWTKVSRFIRRLRKRYFSRYFLMYILLFDKTTIFNHSSCLLLHISLPSPTRLVNRHFSTIPSPLYTPGVKETTNGSSDLPGRARTWFWYYTDSILIDYFRLLTLLLTCIHYITWRDVVDGRDGVLIMHCNDDCINKLKWWKVYLDTNHRLLEY